jgi:hypothetical protein
MSVPLSFTPRKYSGTRQSPTLAITDGEINFLWSFIQGSIMIPETWNRLLHGCGFCERHAWIHASVEMSFRYTYLLGPTILYSALIEKFLREVRTAPRANAESVVRKFRATDACFLCAMNIKDATAAVAPQARLDQGRDSFQLHVFARGLEPLWRGYVCTSCEGREAESVPNRCRRHVLADVKARKPVDLSKQKELLQELHVSLTRYQSSFLACGPLASDRDRAAFLIAIGWCSGWRPLLTLLKQNEGDP